MTFEEEEIFAKSIIKDIEENEVTYVCDATTKMCTVGKASKVIISYDAVGGIISVLGIRNCVFRRMFLASPMKEYVIKIEKLCSEKGKDERPNLVNIKNPRIR